jgi:hypothetical protein
VRSVEVLKMPNHDLDSLWNSELADASDEQPGGLELALTSDLSLAKTNNGCVVRRVLI